MSSLKKKPVEKERSARKLFKSLSFRDRKVKKKAQKDLKKAEKGRRQEEKALKQGKRVI